MSHPSARTLARLAVASAAFAASACAGSAPRGSEAPTYYADVLPILQDNCQVCHMESGLNLGGMVAPVAFTSYETTSEWAPRIARAVRTGTMPPWHADARQHGDFENERYISPAQIGTLVAWANAGAPAGDPADAPEPRHFPTSTGGWSIGEPDLIVKLPEPYLVEDSIEDQYITFDVTIDESQLPEDRWVKAVEFRPGSSAVHHIIANPLGGIAPGVGPRVYPDGISSVLRTGTTVGFQMHYHKQPGPGTAVWDQSEAAIVFYEPGEVIEHVIEGADMGMYRFAIPPNDPNYSFSAEQTFDKDVDIQWMTPHMHLRGKAALYELAYPGGQVDTLLYVPRYDFNWQHTYHYREPVRAPAGSKLRLTLWWDNSSANRSNPDPSRTVRFGLPTTDEMGFGFVSYTDVHPVHYVVGEPIPEDVLGSQAVTSRPPS